MSESIAVIGAGVAGAAAAFGARRAGKRVTVISQGAGASAMMSGAVDDRPWEVLEAAARVWGDEPKAAALPSEVLDFVSALDLWAVPEARGVRLATLAGRIRMARGSDRALLDMSALLPGTLVLIPRVCRAAWDADALSDALNDDPYARRRGFLFLAVDTPVLRFAEEPRISDIDLAARHDDDQRIAWLAENLKHTLVRVKQSPEVPVAMLLGPWLGMRAPAAAALSARLGAPAGEALLGIGSPSGFRFEHARDRLLASLGADRVNARVRGLRARGEEAMVCELEDGRELSFDAVVLALGGMAGGGISYCPPDAYAGEDMPPTVELPFALSLKAEVSLALGRDAVDIASSMHGPELDADSWPAHSHESALSRVGIRAEGVCAGPRVFVAGECIAGHGRTVLSAVSSGLAAGSEA